MYFSSIGGIVCQLCGIGAGPNDTPRLNERIIERIHGRTNGRINWGGSEGFRGKCHHRVYGQGVAKEHDQAVHAQGNAGRIRHPF